MYQISQIEALDNLANTLTSLELGSNRIRVSRILIHLLLWPGSLISFLIDKYAQHITNLSCLTNLTELWLGRNKISKLEGLDALVNLRSVRHAASCFNHPESWREEKSSCWNVLCARVSPVALNPIKPDHQAGRLRQPGQIRGVIHQS